MFVHVPKSILLPPDVSSFEAKTEQPGHLGLAKDNPAGLPDWAKEEAPTACGKLQFDLLGTVLPFLAAHRRLTLKPAGNSLFS